MTLRIERVDLDEVPWDVLDTGPGRMITQTRPWLDFLVETQGLEPVAGRVLDDGEHAGWFTGGIARRFGLRFLGSPMRGWTTGSMGFDLVPGASVAEAVEALPAFAFGDLGCIHLEVADRNLMDESAVSSTFAVTHLTGYELDITVDDDVLRAGMKRDARYNIGLAARKGVVIETVDPLAPGDFAAVYHDQVSEAFAKRGQTPSYRVDRVESVIRHLGPTGNLLLLRARTEDGETAATGIFPGQPGGSAEYWMGASYRRLQSTKSNELLMWTALRTWRDRGAVRMNFGGGGSYKAKYGGEPHSLPWLRASRFAVVERARTVAFDQYRRRKARVRKRAGR